MSVRIPVHGRGGLIVFALVDECDAPLVNAYRWRLLPAGYAIRGGWSDGANFTIYMHREVLGLERGDGKCSDHVSGDKLDNRRSNLRVVSHAQNMQNRRSQRQSSSRFRNVSWANLHRKWHACAYAHGRKHHLGFFTDEIEAAQVAEAFRAQHMPFAMPDPVLAAHLANRPTRDPIADDGYRQELAA